MGFAYGLAGLWLIFGLAMLGQMPLLGVVTIALAVGTFVYAYKFSKEEDEKATARAAASSSYTVPTTSDWETRVANIVTRKASGYRIVRNDRSVIPSRDGGENLEIDIYIPELRLGFEANGEYWHNHSGYRADLSNGTAYTMERYKEKWCAEHGIKLVHLWDSQSDYDIENTVAMAVSERRGW